MLKGSDIYACEDVRRKTPGQDTRADSLGGARAPPPNPAPRDTRGNDSATSKQDRRTRRPEIRPPTIQQHASGRRAPALRPPTAPRARPPKASSQDTLPTARRRASTAAEGIVPRYARRQLREHGRRRHRPETREATIQRRASRTAEGIVPRCVRRRFSGTRAAAEPRTIERRASRTTEGIIPRHAADSAASTHRQRGGARARPPKRAPGRTRQRINGEHSRQRGRPAARHRPETPRGGGGNGLSRNYPP